MQSPKNKKEVRGFLGRIQFISRFIFKLTMTRDSLFRLLRKGEKFVWDSHCQTAFDKIKTYLENSPVISLPKPNKPLLLDLFVSENLIGCMLA